MASTPKARRPWLSPALWSAGLCLAFTALAMAIGVATTRLEWVAVLTAAGAVIAGLAAGHLTAGATGDAYRRGQGLLASIAGWALTALVCLIALTVWWLVRDPLSEGWVPSFVASLVGSWLLVMLILSQLGATFVPPGAETAAKRQRTAATSSKAAAQAEGKAATNQDTTANADS